MNLKLSPQRIKQLELEYATLSETLLCLENIHAIDETEPTVTIASPGLPDVVFADQDGYDAAEAVMFMIHERREMVVAILRDAGVDIDHDDEEITK